MRRVLSTAVALLLGCNAALAQVSTMGTTAMGLSSTPATIVTSPLNGPSPFSATTQPGAPDTTLAPAPLASDPATPGTVVTCAAPTGQITPGTPAVPAITTMPPTATAQAAALGATPTSIVATTTGNISPTVPLGSPSTIVCSSMPGGPPTNGAALPLTTPQIPANPPPGTIQQDVAQLGVTSIDPTAVMPTPNTSACAESTTMNLAMPGTMAPANATGAAATPGVSPPGC
ncbi:hypothetical protein [Bradyrhizobium sp.]